MEQLKKCKYAVIVALAKSFKASLPRTVRPHTDGPLVTVVPALMKLRLNASPFSKVTKSIELN